MNGYTLFDNVLYNVSIHGHSMPCYSFILQVCSSHYFSDGQRLQIPPGDSSVQS